MSNQEIVTLLNSAWQIGAGTILNTAATATISPQLPTTKDYAVPSGEWRPNKTLQIEADGVVSSGGVASNLTVFLAGGVTPTTLSTGPAIALGTGSLANLHWRLWARIRCLAVASSGNTLETKGGLLIGNATAPALGTANGVVADLPLTSAAVDLTAACAVLLRATLSSANGSITCHTFLVKSLN